MMRCPSCGAGNPDSAAWCNQCLAGLSEPATTPGPAGGGRDPVLRRRGDIVEWACPGCGVYWGIDQATCQACGTPIAQHLLSGATAAPVRAWTTALWLSLVAPGAGHLLVQRIGSGFARLLLFVVWLVGGWAVARTDGPGAAVAAPLLLGAAVVWVGSLADLALLARGGRELLAGRVLLWLVVAVTGLTLLGAIAAAGLLAS